MRSHRLVFLICSRLDTGFEWFWPENQILHQKDPKSQILRSVMVKIWGNICWMRFRHLFMRLFGKNQSLNSRNSPLTWGSCTSRFKSSGRLTYIRQSLDEMSPSWKARLSMRSFYRSQWSRPGSKCGRIADKGNKNKAWRRLGPTWAFWEASWTVLEASSRGLGGLLGCLGPRMVANLAPSWLPKTEPTSIKNQSQN